ncbi:hypothetical protein BE21_32820 [Sorangium cellulosum]|uniref:Uncharacterized protein n=1 Tax=Sorangium cellulosum TaxID=56 RepID=A0A150TQN8_SORCE|nr:hypothetical protein BE21_32820 [Sorangium cellulosum]
MSCTTTRSRGTPSSTRRSPSAPLTATTRSQRWSAGAICARSTASLGCSLMSLPSTVVTSGTPASRANTSAATVSG